MLASIPTLETPANQNSDFSYQTIAVFIKVALFLAGKFDRIAYFLLRFLQIAISIHFAHLILRTTIRKTIGNCF